MCSLFARANLLVLSTPKDLFNNEVMWFNSRKCVSKSLPQCTCKVGNKAALGACDLECAD